MYHSEFFIGKEFRMHGKMYRCTDVGQRTILGICIDLPRTIHMFRDGHKTEQIVDNPSWFNGPPYAVVEIVFDEDTLMLCQESS